MRLRPKIALMLALMVAPSFAAVSWFRLDIESKLHRDRMVERAGSFLAREVPRGCIRRPESWRGRRGMGPGIVMHAYDASYHSVNPKAPPIPVAALESVPDSQVLRYKPTHPKRTTGLVIKVAASPECHFIGVEFRPPRGARGRQRRHLMTLAIVLGISTVTGLLIAIPLVRRISRLTAAMNDASETHPQVLCEVQSGDELGDMARSFNALGDRVQGTIESLQRRDEVLRSHVANTSHDLAIPLTVIQHRLKRSLDLLPDDADSKADLAAALEESAYMASLVRNLNVSTKLEAHDLYFEPIPLDLQETLRRVESRFIALAKMKEVEFNLATLDAPIPVRADPVLLEQAISNVVQNAVQYAPRQGHVALVVHLRDEGFEVRVIDDGPGIPEGVIETMLRAGARDLSVRGRNPEGLGLGLSITREVCALHGWTLALRNRTPEEGLEVTLRGPRDTPTDA